MKKLHSFFLFTSVAIAFAACDEDEPVVKNPDIPEISLGAYVLNEGSYYNKIEGGLNVIDYAGKSIANNVFSTTNHRSLGNTPQCGVAYGSKIYVGVYGSNTIEIIDRYTYKSVKQISLENSSNGQEPRSMVARGGKVYVAMYDGYVARLDTLTASIDASVKVGPNPETMTIHGNHLFIPNSGGMNYPEYNNTVSIVALEPFSEVKTFEVPLNPTQCLSNGTNLFVLCMGNYADQIAAVYEVTPDYKSTKISDATLTTINDNTLYIVNFPYGGQPSYFNYDISGKKMTEVSYAGIEAPSGIGVDPMTGNIILTSYAVEDGMSQYNIPGKTILYDAKGILIKEFAGGVGAGHIFFNME